MNDPESRTEAALEPGTTLGDGRYILERELGEGGMAKVWVATDERLGVRRAVKLLDRVYARSPSVRERFTREAQLMARLEHPHVVPVYDIGREGGHTWIVMSLMEEGSIGDRVIASGPLPPAVAVKVILQILHALGAAHELGIVHRDIKPANILIDGNGAARLSDFGVASLSSSALTRTGSIMGTWTYMAPEQRNSAKGVDGRADLYAVGATLLAIVTGRTPYDLHNSESHGEQLAGLHPGVAAFVEHCTRYHPDDRYQTAAEAIEALESVLFELSGSTSATPPVALGGMVVPVAGKGAETMQNYLGEDSALDAFPSEAPAEATPSRVPWLLMGGGVAGVLGVIALALPLLGWLGASMMASETSPAPHPVANAEAVPDPEPEPEPQLAREVVEAAPVAEEPIPRARPSRAIKPAPARPEPEPAEPVAQGRAIVSSLPSWSHVVVDGEKVGTTRWTGELPVGTHTVELQHQDGKKVRRVLEISAEAPASLCWDFDHGGPCAR